MEGMRNEPASRPAKRRQGPALAAWALVAAVMPAATVGAQERSAEAAFDLVGTVTDQAGVPLVGVFVASEGSEWGSLTDKTGRFLLPRTSAGQITLTAELIGYETLTWTGWVQAGRLIALTLASKPILLEGLTVVADRFESRRRATATSVRWFDRTALATAPQENAVEFLAARGGFTRVSCRGYWGHECVWVRGQAMEPSVWVDESPLIGGLDFLRMIQPHELYLVEVYAGGRHIRAYTNHYIERAAERRVLPIALLF